MINNYEFQKVTLKDKAILPDILKLYTKYLPLFKDDYYDDSDEGIVNFLLSLIKNFPFYICRYEGELAGIVFLDNILEGNGKVHSANLHVIVDRKYWGIPVLGGIMLFFKYLFNTVGLKRLEAEFHADNKITKRLLERLQFKYVGMKEHATMKNGSFVNNIVYELTEDYYRRNY